MDFSKLEVKKIILTLPKKTNKFNKKSTQITVAQKTATKIAEKNFMLIVCFRFLNRNCLLSEQIGESIYLISIDRMFRLLTLDSFINPNDFFPLKFD